MAHQAMREHLNIQAIIDSCTMGGRESTNKLCIYIHITIRTQLLITSSYRQTSQSNHLKIEIKQIIQEKHELLQTVTSLLTQNPQQYFTQAYN